MPQTRTAPPLAVDEEVRQTGRLPGDDFFCLRYQVWYASVDCALRTKFRTSAGCLQCDQGRFNLRRHHTALYGTRSISHYGVTDPGPLATQPPTLDAAKIRGVVFDLDGTLVDSYGAIRESVNHARQTFGQPPLTADAVRAVVGRGLECLLADVLGPERVVEGVRLFRERYAEVFLERTTRLEGAAETLGTLHARGLRLAVASNKPARFSRGILEHLGLSRYLGAVHGPDTVGSTKPDPAMLHRSMADLGLGPGQILYVGDMLLDVTSAARAGVPVVLVQGGSSSASELRSTGQLVVPHLTRLSGLLHENREESPGIPA